MINWFSYFKAFAHGICISIANQMNIMETIILPITSSIEFNEGKSPQPSGQSSEFFAKVLDEHQPQIANEKTGSIEEKDDNPDSSSATDLSPSMLGEIPSLLISPARLQLPGNSAWTILTPRIRMDSGPIPTIPPFSP